MICGLLAIGTAAHAGLRGQNANEQQKGAGMTKLATGTFEVKLTPLPVGEQMAGPEIGRMGIDKQYHGDLEGAGKGEMLSAMGTVKGSGAYVAIEKVSGTLGGRKGTFVLQHSGAMRGGVPDLKISVAPDSGTGELKGLTGKMNIIIADGKHSYEFEYTLEQAK